MQLASRSNGQKGTGMGMVSLVQALPVDKVCRELEQHYQHALHPMMDEDACALGVVSRGGGVLTTNSSSESQQNSLCCTESD